MTSRWHRALLRLSRMSGDEMRTRASQEMGKRLDRIAYRCGHDFNPADAGFSENFEGEFFFQADEVPERAALLKHSLPQETASVLNEAEAICQHRFNLLGYSNLDYGAEIDWHLDAVHGKRAPLKPWYKINYLDLQEVGDHKVTWELNRHQHLVTLTKAWHLSGETRYATELVRQWYSWRSANPYPMGINWASSLEVAFRSLSWLWVVRLTAGSEAVPREFRSDLLRALALNGRHIERYLSTYFSPNTHLLGEGVALFFIGRLCPQLLHAERWQSRGWEIVLQAAKQQVSSDGVYFEQALHYHVYALDFFLHARILASRNGMGIPAEFDAMVEKMLAVVEALSQAGPAEGFGDDDGGRLFDSRRNRTEHMTDPLALGAAVYGRDSIRSAAKLTEEAVWLFGERAFEAVKTPVARAIHSQAFEAGGIYVFAGTHPRPQEMVVDAGPQGTGRCGHGHADALSIRMTVDGRRLLVDSGTGAYISDTKDRDLFRGTGAHNTLRVDGQDQAIPAGSFAWAELPNVKVECWVAADSFDLFVASHDGYCRLADPVLHRRFVFRGPGGLWLVRDVCEGRGNHLIESFWHFAEDLTVTHQHGAVIAAPTETGTRLVLLNAGNSAFQEELGSGLLSPAYGIKKTAAMARVFASLQLPAECAVMMVTQESACNTGKFVAITTSQHQALRAYRYQIEEVAHSSLFSGTVGSWSFESWKSDAEFLYWRTERSRLVQFVMVRGSFATWQNKKLVSQSRAVEKFEWPDRTGDLPPAPSEGTELAPGREYLKCVE